MKRPCILVTDDEANIRMMLRTALESDGYDVLEASNGREALDVIKQSAPDLMVLDLNMPVLDGLETVSKLRELEGPGEQIPIVAITAFDVPGMEDAALETGCNRYLRKPLDLEELDRTLRSLGFVL